MKFLALCPEKRCDRRQSTIIKTGKNLFHKPIVLLKKVANIKKPAQI